MCGGGIFFLLFRERLVEFEVWVGSSSTETGRETTVGVRLGVVVCVDDPTAHQLTSGSNMNRTRTRIRASGLTCVPRHKDMCGERGGRKECVRGISERGRERRGGTTRKRNVRASRCARKVVLYNQSKILSQLSVKWRAVQKRIK